jgi:hypothetical protein
MRCGRPIEIGGFQWKPEEIGSYKIDYSDIYPRSLKEAVILSETPGALT